MPRKTVNVTAPGKLLGAVLQACDGRTAWKDVAATLGQRWASAPLAAFLAQLLREGALVEASEALACWSDIGQLPSLHARIATADELPLLHKVAQQRLLPGEGLPFAAQLPAAARALQSILRGRASHRTFADAPLPADTLASILWAAHGVTLPADDPALGWRRSVGSGGNMHSARWFVFVLRELPNSGAGPMTPGLYEARFHLEGGCSLLALPGADADAAWRTVADPRVLTFASALALPVYDIGVPARKYGNRATLFAHLEAGQSLQNAQLMATALGAAAMVRGDTASSAVLGILYNQLAPAPGACRSHWLAMPGLVIGARPSEAEIAKARTEHWITLGAATTLSPFAFSAGPVPLASGELYATGRSSDPRIAALKAEAEAWERLGWGALAATVEGARHDMPGAIDPTTIAAYTPAQLASPHFPLKAFSPRRRYLWNKGVAVASGGAVHLPAECVHALSALPARFRPRACSNASTSGVAAWTDAEGALSHATLELIERDAFLRRWLTRAALPCLRLASLPQSARRRIQALQAAGLRVSVADIGERFVPVYSVFTQSIDRPFTAITAAAGFDAEAALAKALDEAEGRAAHAAAFPAAPLRRASEVQTTADINRYFQTPRFYRQSDFYAAGEDSQRFKRRPAHAQPLCADWAALKSRLAQLQLPLFAFDITPPGASVQQGRAPLHVVRAVVPGLLPIWFQHGLQPAASEAFRAAVRAGPDHAPRARSDAAFIHPFT
ncbi:MAG TPA: YcaO-like family protein [Ramlibacter sp.]|nr:YcaO-like family protein [Ramlibacter sp.]